MHDFEMGGVRASAPAPETVRLGDSSWGVLTRDWQEFWYAAFLRYSPAPETAKAKWAELLHSRTAFTNLGNGSDVLADYINGTNLDQPPMRQDSLTTGGNVVLLSGSRRNFGGLLHLGVWCLDRDTPPAVITTLEPFFLHRATICRPDGQVWPFPHNDGNHVPVPFVSNTGRQAVVLGIPVRENWILAERIMEITGEPPSPYVR